MDSNLSTQTSAWWNYHNKLSMSLMRIQLWVNVLFNFSHRKYICFNKNLALFCLKGNKLSCINWNFPLPKNPFHTQKFYIFCKSSKKFCKIIWIFVTQVMDSNLSTQTSAWWDYHNRLFVSQMRIKLWVNVLFIFALREEICLKLNDKNVDPISYEWKFIIIDSAQ